MQICNFKNDKEISKQNNDKYQGRKKFFPGKKHVSAAPLLSPWTQELMFRPKQNKLATITTFIGAVISYTV